METNLKHKHFWHKKENWSRLFICACFQLCTLACLHVSQCVNVF